MYNYVYRVFIYRARVAQWVR